MFTVFYALFVLSQVLWVVVFYTYAQTRLRNLLREVSGEEITVQDVEEDDEGVYVDRVEGEEEESETSCMGVEGEKKKVKKNKDKVRTDAGRVYAGEEAGSVSSSPRNRTLNNASYASAESGEGQFRGEFLLLQTRLRSRGKYCAVGCG